MTQTVARKARVMSGMRPTGELHLGHLVGVLTQWARYSETADAFFEIADLHAYTTDFEDPSKWLSDVQIADVPRPPTSTSCGPSLPVAPWHVTHRAAKITLPCAAVPCPGSSPRPSGRTFFGHFHGASIAGYFETSSLIIKRE